LGDWYKAAGESRIRKFRVKGARYSNPPLLPGGHYGHQRKNLPEPVGLPGNLSHEEIAEDTGANRSDVICQALALMKVAHIANKDGHHLGIVNDARNLDTEIVGLI
jgi:hypothetical protein